MALDLLLSDHLRAWKLVAALVLAAGLGIFYSHLNDTVAIAWPQCVADPERFDGTLLSMPLWTVTAIEGPDRYQISWVVADVPVAGPTEDLAVGQTVSVVGTFVADGPVVIEQFHEVHHLRPIKLALGAIGVLIALGAAPFGLRVRRGYLEERELGGAGG